MIRLCRIDRQILRLRELLNLSQSEFASKVGITQGALSQLESGKSTVSLNTLYKINRAFDVNFNWLIKDSGQPFDQQELPSNPRVDAIASGLIPLVNEEAHAGYVSQYHSADYLETLDVYKIPGYDSGGNYRLFEVTGDSMEPSLHNREMVVAEYIDLTNLTLASGALAILVTTDGLLAKRVYLDTQNPQQLILRSDNPTYKDVRINISDILEMWAIRAKITSVFLQEPTDRKKLAALETDVREMKREMQQLRECINQLKTAADDHD